MISQMGAYSRLLRPAPSSLSGRNMFHSPAALAWALSFSIVCVGCQGLPAARMAAISSLNAVSPGTTCSCTKAITRCCSATTLGLYEKSMPVVS